ncbi:MAG: FkbM family methyltransferase [Proteobacteria bacterium]|nr:FkbM family methyltransferase [Pseudomonadota bacterium]
MKQLFKNIIKPLLRKAGYEIKKIDGYFTSDPFDVKKTLISQEDKIIIFDVGANRGQTTQIYLEAFPKSTVYCFEPFEEVFNFLKNKFSNNKNVFLLPYAITNKSGFQNFYINENDETNSLLPRIKEGRRYYSKKAGPKTEIKVQTITIDDFVINNKIPKIDILKLDIQGGELLALEGATNTLRDGKISLIYTEVFFVPHYENSPLFNHICNFLERFGYSLFNIYNLQRAKNGQLRYGDALFVSESLRKNVIDSFPEEP